MSRSVVIPLFSTGRPRFAGDDAALVTAIRSGQTGCTAELFDRYGTHVQRVLTNVLGFDRELADLIEQTLVTQVQPGATFAIQSITALLSTSVRVPMPPGTRTISSGGAVSKL